MDSATGAAYIGAMEMMLLRTFVAVADLGGFTTAAERLCVTQSAVSRRVRQLEDYYGVTLLDRAAEPVKPTPAGAILLNRARQMLDIENEIEESVHRLTLRQHIGFACTPCFGAAYLPAVVERFVAMHGMVVDLNINFQMPEQVLAGVLSGKYDVAVIEHCADLDLTSFTTRELPADDMTFVSAPALGLTPGLLTTEQLFAERLFFKARHGCAHRFLNQGLRELGLEPDRLTKLSFYDDLPGVVRQVCDGHGLAFMSRVLVAAELASGELQEHVLAGFNCLRPRSLVTAKKFQMTDILHDFVEQIFISLDQRPPGDLPTV